MDWTRGNTIGQGSSATVSTATSHLTGEVFAVKSVELSQSKILQKEEAILSQLSCPNLVKYMGCDVTEENGDLLMYNLFMEYIPGGTLTDLIRKHGGSLHESLIRSHLRDVLQGLVYLHSIGLVHCDIKGRNILIGENGAKIADFGCARWVENTKTEEGTTRLIVGTPAFMSPEVARGEDPSFAADVWALGCVLIEMATGSAPWSNSTDPLSVIYRISTSEEVPEVPSFLSDQAKDFLSKCLRRNPSDRWSVDHLLKHPFLQESNSNSDLSWFQLKKTISPTSVLEEEFWNSIEESDAPRIGCSNSAADRLEQLSRGGFCSAPRVPDWSSDENWITVRSDKNSPPEDPTPTEEPEMACELSTVVISYEIEMEHSESSAANEKNVVYTSGIRCFLYDTGWVNFTSHGEEMELYKNSSLNYGYLLNRVDNGTSNSWNRNDLGLCIFF